MPVICSPVGVNADIVSDGQSGLLAGDENSWYQALLKLSGDRECRKRLGEAGLAVVETGYDLTLGAEKVMEAYGLTAQRAEEDGDALSDSAADSRR